MTGRLRAGLAALLAGAALAMPALGQQRTLGVLPGSGIVKRSGPAPRPKGEVPMSARVRRMRRNIKRHRDAIRCWFNNPCRRGVMTDHVQGYGNGK